MVEETVPAAEGTGNSGDFYTAAQNGYDLTNTLTGTTEISGSKIWTDNGRTERTEITLNLYAN